MPVVRQFGKHRVCPAFRIICCFLVLLFFGLSAKNQEINLNLLATVSEQQVHLSWQLPPSCNTDFFVIESSGNGKDFTVLAMVQALKNSASSEKYSYLDDLVGKGTRFYRLKEVDREGKVSYSEPVKVVIGIKKVITVFPNPTKGELNVSHPLSNGKEQIHLLDMNGNLILQKDIATSTVLTKLDLHGLTKGTYQVMWTADQEKLIQRFVLH